MFTTENKTKGFTLLEMLIALAIFTIAVFIAVSTLFSITNVQKKIIAKQSAEDNLRFAFESMAKEIRTGKIFHCGTSGTLTSPQNCPFPSGGNSFTFKNSQKLTSPEFVIVNKMNFYVSGATANDGAQSLATIVLDGQVLDPKNIGTAKLVLQTTISKSGLLDH